MSKKRISNVLWFPLTLLLAIVGQTRCNTAQTQPEDGFERQERKQEAVKPIRHIIWDLNGVFFETSRIGMAREIDLPKLIWYTITHFKNPGKAIKSIAFEILDTVELGIEVPAASPENIPAADGLPMPRAMQAWVLGLRDGNQIIDAVHAEVRAGRFRQLFSSRGERRLTLNLIRTMLSAEVLAKHTYALKGGPELLRACAQAGCTNWALSNRASDVIDLLKQTAEGQKVFEQIADEHTLLSSQINLMKPNPAIYEYVIHTYDLDPDECVVIDDNENNLRAAKRAGFSNTILVKGGDLAAVQKQLSKLGVFA
ncbi:MAG: HAD-IA family hydrolase [Candidatus Dependentiae bacterium]|nr:HAD-IA family hydrolase [Candidatus Dependentiae bacterium]